MKYLMIVFVSLALTLAADTDAHADEHQNLFTMDEQVWVLFYDVPSRRFRRSRDAFVRRDWSSVSNDLTSSAGFIRAEAARAADELVYPLENVADRLDEIAENIQSPQISGSHLDAAFARAHWLLAQHYLELSVVARDTGKGRITGYYLWATAHHLERTVLWSNARMSRGQVRDLERLRDLAARLRDDEDPAAVFKDKPIALARKTLVDLGEFLDRKIWIDGS